MFICHVLRWQTKWKSHQLTLRWLVILETWQWWKGSARWLVVSETLPVSSQPPAKVYQLITVTGHQLRCWTVGRRSCQHGGQLCTSMLLCCGLILKSSELHQTPLSPATLHARAQDDSLLDICKTASSQCWHIVQSSACALFDLLTCKLAHLARLPWGTFTMILVLLCLLWQPNRETSE